MDGSFVELDPEEVEAAVEEFWQEIYKITKVFAKASKKSDSKDKLTSTTRRTSSMNTVAAGESDTQDAYSFVNRRTSIETNFTLYSRTPIYRDPIYRNPDFPGGFLYPDFFLKISKFCRLVNLHLQFARSNGDHVSVRFDPSN
eukprot:sb/3474130/